MLCHCSMFNCQFTEKAKPRRALRLLGVFIPGNDLVSHTVARAVPSALRGLTSVFGMGTGGSLSLGSPRTCENWCGCGILTGGAIHLMCTVNFMVKPNEQLVTVSSTCRHASTSVLSNRSSSCALNRYLNLGRSHLGEGFTLICVQRLS